jgi:hypothetical protein
MKRNFIKHALIGLTALILSGGCEDFLEQEVPGAITADVFYETEAEAMQATVAIYDILSAHYSQAWSSMYMLKTLPSDESFAGGSGPGDQPAYQALDDFTHGAENDAINRVWRLTYGAVTLANRVINNVEPSTDIRRQAIAEAKTLRAYAYLDLLSLWGDVPLVLDDVPAEEWTTTARAPKAEVYAQIEQDLTEAIAVLPVKSEYQAAERYKVSKGTAQALLGKAHLFQEEWSEAAEQFDAVINSGQYGLESSVAVAFSNDSEFGKESVFELSYSSTQNYGGFPWDWRPESNIQIQLMGPRGDYYTKAPSDSLNGGWGFNIPTEKIWNAFEDSDTSEERKWANIMSEEELKAMGGNWTAPDAYEYTGFLRRKYGTFSTETGAPDAALNYGTNWRMIRYADVLLMAAEAHFRAGTESQAITYLNMVRERSELDPIEGLAGEALFMAIVRERQLELAFEGFRFIDLVRWGLADEELVEYGFVPGKHEVLPIPIIDVRTYSLQQNPGY